MSTRKDKRAVRKMMQQLQRLNDRSKLGSEAFLAEIGRTPSGRRNLKKPAWYNLIGLIRFNCAEAGASNAACNSLQYEPHEVKISSLDDDDATLGGFFLITSGVGIIATAISTVYSIFWGGGFHVDWYWPTAAVAGALALFAYFGWPDLLARRDVIWNAHVKDRQLRTDDRSLIAGHVRDLVDRSLQVLTGPGSDLDLARAQLEADRQRLLRIAAELEVQASDLAKSPDANLSAVQSSSSAMVKRKLQELSATIGQLDRQIARIEAVFNGLADRLTGNFTLAVIAAKAQQACGAAQEHIQAAHQARDLSFIETVRQMDALAKELRRFSDGVTNGLVDADSGDLAGDLNRLDLAIGSFEGSFAALSRVSDKALEGNLEAEELATGTLSDSHAPCLPAAAAASQRQAAGA